MWAEVVLAHKCGAVWADAKTEKGDSGGGVVFMAFGWKCPKKPLKASKKKAKKRKHLKSSLPKGVEVHTVYDRLILIVR